MLAGHMLEVAACAFSPDGRLALSASGDRTLRLWDVAAGETVREFEGHTEEVYCCEFGLDGRQALSGSGDWTLRLWDVARAETVRVLEGYAGVVLSCVFSPDGRQILSAGDRSLRLWTVATGMQVRLLRGHEGTVTGCSFSPDGRQVLLASNDRTPRLWDMGSGAELARWLTDFALHCCAYGPDGQRRSRHRLAPRHPDLTSQHRVIRRQHPYRPTGHVGLQSQSTAGSIGGGDGSGRAEERPDLCRALPNRWPS